MPSIRKKVLTGVIWATAETAGVRVVQFATFLILARALSREDFGLVALASVYIAFLQLVVRMGITDAIIQREDLTDLHKDTAYWATVILGVIAILLSIVIAPLAASWSGEPELQPIIYCLAIGIIPLSLSRVQQGLLMRRLSFRSLAIRGWISTSSGAVVGITMALNGYGVWSLVAQQLVERFAEWITLWWVTRWFPKLRFSLHAFGEIWTYASRIVGINLLQFAGSNIDRLLIGQFFGVGALGVYVVGRRFVEVILGITRVVILKVTMSAFSRLQSNTERLVESSAAVARVIALFGFPVMALFVFYGEDITAIVFGEKWRDAGVICQIIAVGGMARTSTFFAQPLLKAKGHPGSLLRATAVQVVVSILLGGLLASYGLQAFTAGWAAGSVVFSVMLFYYIADILDYPIAVILRQYLGIAVALVLSWLSVEFLPTYMNIYSGSLLANLALQCFLFFLAYAFFVMIFGYATVKQAYLEVRALIRPDQRGSTP